MDSPVDYFYQDALRWSFGFENPNKAAVLFACLFPLLWMLWWVAWRITGRYLKWSVLILTSAVVLIDSFCLFKTYSRGGEVSAFASAAYLFCILIPPRSDWERSVRSTKSVFGTVLAAAILVLLFWTGLGARSLDPMVHEDESISNRLTIWRSALEMAVDNPHGFGVGHSGQEYMQWYEPLEIKASYRTVVSSYLTFLVEQGWVITGGVLALFLVGWFYAVPNPAKPFSYEMLMGLRASLIAFLVSGIFTTTMEEPVLWIIPGVCAILLLIGCWQLRSRFTSRGLYGAALSSIGILALLYICGLIEREFDSLVRSCGPFEGQVTVISIQYRTPTVQPLWAIYPDKNVLGENYGRLLRQLVIATHIRLAIRDETPLPDSRLLLVGDAAKATPTGQSLPIVFLAPTEIADQACLSWLKASPHVTLLLPSIDEDGRVRAWESGADSARLKPDDVIQLSGVGLRVDWAWSQVIDVVKAN